MWFEWCDPFLIAIFEGHPVTRAALAAGIHKDTAYKFRCQSNVFTDRWRTAEKNGRECRVSRLHSSAFERATEGWEEDVFSRNGEKVGTRRRYDNRLTLKMLEREDPVLPTKAGADEEVAARIQAIRKRMRESVEGPLSDAPADSTAPPVDGATDAG